MKSIASSITETLKREGIDIDKQIEVDCVKCGEPAGSVAQGFQHSIHCQKCVDKYEHDRRIEDTKAWWTKFCPALYRETDLNHPDFKRIYPMVKRYDDYRQNLIFCGSSGTCKTRAMMHRMKLALIAGRSGRSMGRRSG